MTSLVDDLNTNRRLSQGGFGLRWPICMRLSQVLLAVIPIYYRRIPLAGLVECLRFCSKRGVEPYRLQHGVETGNCKHER
jgi:hypothetical protein